MTMTTANMGFPTRMNSTGCLLGWVGAWACSLCSVGWVGDASCGRGFRLLANASRGLCAWAYAPCAWSGCWSACYYPVVCLRAWRQVFGTVVVLHMKGWRVRNDDQCRSRRGSLCWWCSWRVKSSKRNAWPWHVPVAGACG